MQASDHETERAHNYVSRAGGAGALSWLLLVSTNVKKHTGISPAQYQTQQRLLMCKGDANHYQSKYQRDSIRTQLQERKSICNFLQKIQGHHTL